MSSKGMWTGSVIAMAGLVALAGCGGEEAAQNSGSMTFEQIEARIAPDAVMLMDRESFSDTYAKLGEQQFQNANDLTRWAAVAAAAKGEPCDSVAMVNVSDRSTRENIVWFTDCQNGERIFVEQPEAESARLQFENAASGEEEA